MIDRPPYKTYTSSREHQDIAQCLGRMGVITGIGDDFSYAYTAGGVQLHWDIKSTPTGSDVRVWRGRGVLNDGGRVRAAEACF